MKEVRVILSKQAAEVYKKLNQEAPKSKQARTMLNAINNKIQLLKQNIYYGNPISKNLIPEEYKRKYELTNLFRVELPGFWRMLYTLEDNGKVEIIAFVLDIVNHKDYNRKFGYK